MDQHTRKVINPDQSEIPFLNSFSAKQGAKKPNKPHCPPKNKQKKGGCNRHTVKFVWLNKLKLYISRGSQRNKCSFSAACYCLKMRVACLIAIVLDLFFQFKWYRNEILFSSQWFFSQEGSRQACEKARSLLIQHVPYIWFCSQPSFSVDTGMQQYSKPAANSNPFSEHSKLWDAQFQKRKQMTFALFSVLLLLCAFL